MPKKERLLWGLVVLLALFALLVGWRVWRLSGLQSEWTQELGTPMVPHPTRLWTLAPGILDQSGVPARIDSHGLREAAMGGGQSRVLTLGDSTIFGHNLGEEDTLHQAVQGALLNRGIDADVHCGAVPGYSTLQTRQLLWEEGPRLEPDLLVIGGLWTDAMFERAADKDWMKELLPPGPLLTPRGLLWRVKWLFSSPLEEDGVFNAVQALAPAPASDWASRARGGAPVAGVRRVAVGDYASNLDWMLQWAAAREIGAVVLAPANLERLDGLPGSERWQMYLQAQRQVAKRRSVSLVDARDALASAGLSGERAFLDGVHPTGEANGLIAESIGAVLAEAGWPERRLVPDGEPGPFDGTKLREGLRTPPSR
ncbi:MAG: hypothetical protein VX519_00620 [Myxococcota bacterium]|nr:hypothetical protein [Myxococcota bacterium]